MNYSDTLKKAMIDKGINGAKALSEQCGVSYHITLRLLKNDNSCRLNDLKTVATYLDIKIDFTVGV